MSTQSQSRIPVPTFTRAGFYSTHKRKILISLALVSVIGLISIICYYSFSVKPASDAEEIRISALLARNTFRRKRNLTDIRLPTSLKPFYYKLSLIPYLDPKKNFSIDGTAQIDIICKEVTDRITVNIRNITIQEPTVTVTRLSERDISINSLIIVKHEYDTDREFYKVILNETLVPGKSYRLSLRYNAVLSDQLVGFYRSSYIDSTTKETR